MYWEGFTSSKVLVSLFIFSIWTWCRVVSLKLGFLGWFGFQGNTLALKMFGSSLKNANGLDGRKKRNLLVVRESCPSNWHRGSKNWGSTWCLKWDELTIAWGAWGRIFFFWGPGVARPTIGSPVRRFPKPEGLGGGGLGFSSAFLFESMVDDESLVSRDQKVNSSPKKRLENSNV